MHERLGELENWLESLRPWPRRVEPSVEADLDLRVERLRSWHEVERSLRLDGFLDASNGMTGFLAEDRLVRLAAWRRCGELSRAFVASCALERQVPPDVDGREVLAHARTVLSLVLKAKYFRPDGGPDVLVKLGPLLESGFYVAECANGQFPKGRVQVLP